MNKEAFLRALERMLYDIPGEERDAAMDFYQSYFEEAGAENEAAVIEELESPQKVAAGIKEGLNNEGNMTSFLKNPPEVRTNQAQSEKSGGARTEEGARADSTGRAQAGRMDGAGMFSGSDFRKSSDTENGAQNGASSGQASYRRYDQYDSGRGREGGMDRRSKWILLIILAVFTSPIWGAAASAALGVIGVMIAFVVVLGLFSVGGVIGGAACAVTGIVRLCTLSIAKGLLLLGTGMLLVAGGGLSIIILLLVCLRLLPWAAGMAVQLVRRLWNWGRSMA